MPNVEVTDSDSGGGHALESGRDPRPRKVPAKPRPEATAARARQGSAAMPAGSARSSSARSSAPSSPSWRCSRSRRCCSGSIRGARPTRRGSPPSIIPAVERAYVFGGPTDLFLLHDQASVRLAMQNYGKTPAVIKEWLVEFVAQEPRGKSPAYEATKRTVANEILEPDKLFIPPPCSARRSRRRSSSSAISPMRTCSGSRTRRGSASASRATARRPMPGIPRGTATIESRAGRLRISPRPRLPLARRWPRGRGRAPSRSRG